MKYYFMVSLAMLAFAANSIFCRMALGEHSIDAASFTCIRLLSGAAMLTLIVFYRNHGMGREHINPLSAIMLFTYAICFSFSYIEVSAGTGALILFPSVHLTLLIIGLFKGERPGGLAWTGMACALAGLVYLLMPGASAPPLFSAVLMIIAGIAWGIYTIRGKRAKNPLLATSWNFIATLPLVLGTYVLFYAQTHASMEGIVLAVLSGAMASALGYVTWYSVLPRLTPTKAATVQLSVPVIAAFGGVLLLAEPLSTRLVIAGAAVLGGVYLTIRTKVAKL